MNYRQPEEKTHKGNLQPTISEKRQRITSVKETPLQIFKRGNNTRIIDHTGRLTLHESTLKQILVKVLQMQCGSSFKLAYITGARLNPSSGFANVKRNELLSK